MNKPKSVELPSFRSNLSHRLRVLEQQFKNRAEAAKAAGVAKGTYQTWVDGRSVPSIEAMARLAQATNTPLDWIAFGINADLPRSDTFAAGVEPPDNYDWMKRIVVLLEDVYLFAGHNPPPDSLYHKAADIYKEIIKWEDSEDRARAITMAIGILAPTIKPPEPEPETSEDKRRA